MATKRGKKILQRLIEGLASIIVVLVFFAILILVFNALFPEGSGLRFVFTPTEEPGQTSESKRQLLIARGSDADRLPGNSEWAAELVRARNSVKNKKADDIVWRTAREGLKLENLDAVQTLEDSSATIRFDQQNVIDLGENSLIVIRRMERDLLFREKRSYMVVVDGELRGRIGGDDPDGVYLEVETPNAVARLQAQPDDPGGIEFKIDVQEDNLSAVTVFSGAAEVEAQGKTVTLGRNQVTRIEQNEGPTEPTTLPDPVVVLAPANRSVFPYRSLPPRVKLSWRDQPQADQYHLMLATDADFKNVLIDQKLERTEFVHGNLQAGQYYWKVSAINTAAEGRFGPVRRFSLYQDQDPPNLEVDFPPEIVRVRNIEIRGTTEPESLVYIAGTTVTPDRKGLFSHRMELERGINIVVVEAVDPAGNVSYRSQMINGKY